MTPTVLTLIAAAAVVAGLAAYALWLWSAVWRREGARRRRTADARDDQVAGLRILARALLDGELNVTESAIRMKVLLDHLRGGRAAAAAYPAIYALHDATEHMPRRLERKRRPAAEIARLDAEREALEARHGEAVRADARRLLDNL